VKPVLENNLISNQFFLTKQTANLMEDFSREITKSSSLFLLYGVGSVGKSRLLQELSNRGISDRKFCYFDFKANVPEADNPEKSDDSDIDDLADEIQVVMDVADERDVILVDHYELATNKARHQLFQSWATDGIDKKLNLIIATTTATLNEVRQLAQQSNIKVKSFQLMPFSTDEVEAFLSFYLFPADSLQILTIPSRVKKQIRSCNGILGKVIEVADQQAGHIIIKAASNVEPKNPKLLAVGSSLLILIMAGTGYQLWQSRGIKVEAPSLQTEKTITIKSDSVEVVSIYQAEPNQPDTTEQDGESTTGSPVTENKLPATMIPSTDARAIDKTDELTIENNVPVEELKSITVARRAEIAEESGIENIVPQRNRSSHDIDSTLEWIKNQDRSRATIQIMMFGSDSFNNGAYQRYLDNLVSKNIDVSKIRIYQTSINDSIGYGVIYGEYQSRREATSNIPRLPEALEAKGPIPRTIGGIWDEIKRQL